MAMEARAFLTDAENVFSKVYVTASSWVRLREQGIAPALCGSPLGVCTRAFVEELLPTVSIAKKAIAEAPAHPPQVQAVAAALQSLVERLRGVWEEHKARGDEFVFIESWPDILSAAHDGREAMMPAWNWLDDPARVFDDVPSPAAIAGAPPALLGPSAEPARDVSHRDSGEVIHSPSVVAPAASEAAELSALDKALALLVSHPEWSDTDIAKVVGVNRTTLYKPAWYKFQAARAALSAGRQARPRGERDADGNLEAWDAK